MPVGVGPTPTFPPTVHRRRRVHRRIFCVFPWSVPMRPPTDKPLCLTEIVIPKANVDDRPEAGAVETDRPAGDGLVRVDATIHEELDLPAV